MQVTSNREHLQIGMVHCNLRTKIPFPNMLATLSSNYLMSQNTIGRSWHAALQYGIPDGNNPWQGLLKIGRNDYFCLAHVPDLRGPFAFLSNINLSQAFSIIGVLEKMLRYNRQRSPLRKQHRSIWVPGTDSNGHRSFHLHCRRR